MAKKKGDRVIIHMACSTCGRKNYSTRKNKKNDKDRLALSKYCPGCKAKVEHKESK
ncbi:MAG: 50S ribosomal protein L33 [bacterium]